jgi:hypothetical protein
LSATDAGEHMGFEPSWAKSSFSADGACVEIAYHEDQILVRDSKDPGGPHLRFSPKEWTAFIKGVLSGEFPSPERS